MGLNEELDVVRDRDGVLGAVADLTEGRISMNRRVMVVEGFILHMKEVGGACSFCALNAALLFNLGATVGVFIDATAILSLLLCPGTPSKVLAGPCLVLSSFDVALFLIAGGGGA